MSAAPPPKLLAELREKSLSVSSTETPSAYSAPPPEALLEVKVLFITTSLPGPLK